MDLDYSGPEFYKFSEDSILLAHKVAEIIKEHNYFSAQMDSLDLGTGSGVIAIELIQKLGITNFSFDLCEVQEDFYPHIANNLELFFPDEIQKKFCIKKSRFSDLLNYDKKYDLIISNPPYFFPDKGRISKSHKRNICRFFIEDSFEIFLKCLTQKLKDNGRAYFIGRFNINQILNTYQELDYKVGEDFNIVKILQKGKISIFELQNLVLKK